MHPLRSIFFALFSLTIASSALGENLVVNPLFEKGLQGWQQLWCREEGLGKAEWLSLSNPGGSHCVRITYQGQRDWSFAQEQRLPVKPGEIYVFSSWVKCENLKGSGQGQLSVVTRDALGSELDWLYGLKNTGIDHDWEKLSGRVMVPDRCATLQFRITGEGPGTTFWSGLTLEKVGEAQSPQALQPVTLTSAGTTLSYLPDTKQLVLTHPTGDSQRLQGWGGGGTLLKLTKSAESRLDLLLADASGNTVSASVELEKDGSALFRLKGDSPLAGDFEFPGPLLSNAKDHWVVPLNEGLYVPADDPYFHTWDLVLYSGHGLCMPFIGLTNGEQGLLAVAETQNDAKARFAAPQEGKTSSWSFLWQPARQGWGYERRLRLIAVPRGGYVGIAKAYRAYARGQGLLVSLKEKARVNPQVDKLVGAVDVWWWKKAESWQEDPQGEIYGKQMKDAGIDRVLWSHEEPGPVVQALNQLGYLTGRYDIYQDVYSPDTPLPWVNKEGWPDCLDLLPNGDWMKGWVSNNGPLSYTGGVICSACILDMAKNHIPKDLQSHAYGARFLDTTTASPLRECYSPRHPLSRTQDRENKMGLFDFVSKAMTLVTGSETGMDMAVPHLDYFEGMMSLGPYRLADAGYNLSQEEKPQEDYFRFQVGPYYRIPLFELVYHDCVVNYWYWGDSSNRQTADWDARDLFNALYGTPPLWIMDPDRWEKDKARFVQSYRTGADTARKTGYLEMVNHAFLTPDHRVQTTEFADGTKVWVNFGEKPFTLKDGTALAPKSWKAVYPNSP